jgi:GTP-binding protein
MTVFQIAIVGRPNVGKSTLFNRLCGRRKAIVGDEPGITRDCVYGSMRLNGKSIEVLDTGGLIPEAKAVIPKEVLLQVESAISESHLILMVVDGRAGITALDEQLLPMMRKTGKPIFTVVNKIDTPELEIYASTFYAFGTEEVFPVSAEHGRGTGELVDAIVQKTAGFAFEEEERQPEEIGVAVVGRPNVGKSSLVNRLVGFKRAIVTGVPGTTRDALDTVLVRNQTRFRIIDTAGIRRKGKTEGLAEKISVVMARRSLKQADVALLLLDAREGVTKLDATIGGYASESGCSIIIVLNKWDLIEKDSHTLVEFKESIQRRMKYLSYAPILTVSALTGQRVLKLFDLIRDAREARRIRIPTGTLNNLFVQELAEKYSSRESQQKLGIRYITQVHSMPPTFVIFLSGRNRLHFSTERYLVNRLREQFGFFATPIRIQQRLKNSKIPKHKDKRQ